MNASDRQYLSRFELDPAGECGWEDLDGFDFSYADDDEMDPFEDENILDAEYPITDDEIPFKN